MVSHVLHGQPVTCFLGLLSGFMLYIVHILHTVAVDVDPAESALLEYKIAAIKHLSYEEYLLVLGDKEDTMQKRYTD